MTLPLPDAPVPIPIHCVLRAFGQTAAWHNAIVIPARDEAERIVACLDAAAAAAIAVTGIIVVVNNSTDATAALVTSWGTAHPAMPLILLDCIFAPADAGVGSARRLGLDLGARMVVAQGALLTTDADTRVRPDWVAQNLTALTRADLVCGTVLGDPEEARALPPAIGAHGSAEWDYLNAAVALAALLDPQPHDPQPAHHNPAGASLAVSRRVYLAAGGLPVIQMGEDRALVERLEALDLRVCYSDKAIVETSCRMTGRTDGGMAGALRSRATEADPQADEWLEPAATCALRHRLRGQLRAVWPNLAAMDRVITDAIGAAEARRLLAQPLPRHCGALIAQIEATAPALARVRLRLSDCRRELPLLQAALAQSQDDKTGAVGRHGIAFAQVADSEIIAHEPHRHTTVPARDDITAVSALSRAARR